MLRCMTTTIHLQRCQRTIRKLACTYVSQRPFSAATVASSGHSRWSKIKHDKAKADDVRNKHRSALAQELTAVSKCMFQVRLLSDFALFLSTAQWYIHGT